MRKLIIGAFILIPYLFACNSGNKQETKTTDTIKPVVKLKLDTNATAAMQYIAGSPKMLSPKFDSLRKQDFYKKHLKFVQDAWKQVKAKHVGPIKKWALENNVTSSNDSATLFYPFSGPDFLYANVFFPYCRNYIMFGLEKIGTMPDFDKMSLAEHKEYFETVESSLGYSNKVGYFVTQYMGSDFNKKNLNGVLHMILYFMGRTNHNVLGVSHFAINPEGEPIELKDLSKKGNEIRGVQVNFTDSDCVKPRSLFYFSIDISDANLKNHPEFMKFVDRFQHKNTYMKAASCILFDPNFITLKKYILDKSDKILQDDTGIPYRDLKADPNFDVRPYGSYTGVIKLINYCFQPDLKKTLDTIKNNKELPFRISYNAWHQEGVLIYAKRKK